MLVIMTSDDLRHALRDGTPQSQLVLRLIGEGYEDTTAWNIVRAAGLVNMTEELTTLTAQAPTEDGETYEPGDGRMIMLASKMTVDATELLALLNVPPQTPDDAVPQP